MVERHLWRGLPFHRRLLVGGRVRGVGLVLEPVLGVALLPGVALFGVARAGRRRRAAGGVGQCAARSRSCAATAAATAATTARRVAGGRWLPLLRLLPFGRRCRRFCNGCIR